MAKNVSLHPNCKSFFKCSQIKRPFITQVGQRNINNFTLCLFDPSKEVQVDRSVNYNLVTWLGPKPKHFHASNTNISCQVKLLFIYSPVPISFRVIGKRLWQFRSDSGIPSIAALDHVDQYIANWFCNWVIHFSNWQRQHIFRKCSPLRTTTFAKLN